MNYLIVVAHPDDEVLGAGGLMYTLSQKKESVNVCILSGMAQARSNRPTTEELVDDTNESLDILGVNNRYVGDFPNIKLNTVPHIELVQFIEKAIIDSKANVIITHHPADLNNDHLHTSQACQAAARLFQRREDVSPLQELLYMEVPSATEWGLNKSMLQFNANTFIEIGENGLGKKIEALSKYRGVMRDCPHPRSNEVLTGLAFFRGSQAGCKYAEAYESVFRKI